MRLHLAVRKENLAEATNRLAYDDVNRKNTDGHTPLHVAVGQGNLEMVRLLCRHGADVNARADLDQTPLHYAANTGRLDIAKVLLHYGAEVMTNCCGGTPLHGAAASGNVALVELLLDRGVDCDSYGYENKTPLYLAALKGWPLIVELLLSLNADPLKADCHGVTPYEILRSSTVDGLQKIAARIQPPKGWGEKESSQASARKRKLHHYDVLTDKFVNRRS